MRLKETHIYILCTANSVFSSNIPEDLYVNSSPLTWTREGGAMVRKEKFKTKNMKDTQNYLYIDGKER